MSARTVLVLVVALMVLAAVIAGGVAWWVFKPAKIVETTASEQRQDDGSIIVARAPDPKAKPKQKIPKGATVERTGSVTAQGETPAGNAIPCPPITIDSTLIRNPDGSKRVILSSPDGSITRAIDIPVETTESPPEPKLWAAGVSYSPIRQTGGIWVERDIARVRLGAEINQVRPIVTSPAGIEARVRIGWTF